MHKSARSLIQESPTAPSDSKIMLPVVGAVLAVCWAIGMLAISSRMHFVIDYRITPLVDQGAEYLEPFASSSYSFSIVILIALVWYGWLLAADRWTSGDVRKALVWMALGQLPTLLWLLRSLGLVSLAAGAWESLWICLCTSLSLRLLVLAQPLTRRFSLGPKAAGVTVVLTCAVATWGWLSQTWEYHGNFMLGFNDFGHFLQRVANTAEGRGLLVETPVLPPFWDHFNPGLLCLVPLWWLFPNVTLVFVLQAASLAFSALFVYLIARQLRLGAPASLLFGLAWLAQPAVGQMNLAYTYGWHPITLAIPLLLAAIWALLARRFVIATGSTLLALSMEEGVFVIVGLTAATSVAIYLVERRRGVASKADLVADFFQQQLSLALWCIVWILSVVGFVLVYRFSGLAEFQTGRFVALGNSLPEIVLSPILRPEIFWGQVLRIESIMFVLLLWMPCGLPALLRGWRWLLPTLLPLGVLIVWDHRPAHSLAFQYPSTLLPLFWLATLWGSSLMAGSRKASQGESGISPWLFERAAVANGSCALIAGLTLSLFWGQLFYSGPTIIEVQAKTYGQSLIRLQTGEDGQWLHSQLQPLRQQQDACLATGRIAAHLVGCRDIETVGQYIQRRQALANLPDRQPSPIDYYRWIVLDRREGFQQSLEETVRVEAEAREAGFKTHAEGFDIVVLGR